jgi:hypothetical protein
MNTALKGIFAVTVLMVSLSANAALVSADGGQVVSDSTLNVTWANVVATGVDWSSSGAAGSAQAWIASLNAADYAGSNNWQLATGDGTYTAGCCVYFPAGTGFGPSTSITANQLGYLFINELGNSYPNPTTLGSAGAAFNTTNTGTGTLPSGYSYTTLANALNNGDYIWSGTPFAGYPSNAWDFHTPYSNQQGGLVLDNFDALAVRPGQVSAVPVPGAAWLLASGLLGLLGLGRRKAETLALRSLG